MPPAARWCSRSAIALAALQIAYLRYGSPGPRGWGLLAVAVPLTLGGGRRSR